MGMQMNFNGLEFPSYFEDLREIVTTVETRLRPIPEIRMHISRFMDGADMDEVYPHLYLGDCDAAMNEQYLLRHGITHVVNAADNSSGPAPVKTGPNYYKDPSITYLGLDLIDLPFINISTHFEKATDFIDSALRSGGTVLVHCRQGRSRSATIVAAFLMMCRNMTAATALTLLRENREIRPNNGFLQQLAQLDLNLFRIRLEKLRNESSSESESESDEESQIDCDDDDSDR
ncbi:dual specificity protein phosphatase 3-like [Homarus americanus]|uniref:protein-serine/threonine phosphatase n=1 Tax=Homarus americanus TaxID=6706 RepID=A0A8J5JDT2_HOMAM|nr:dual specificity protein phosphatase 3-like [Homarus americanus]XP_042208750.1 dual specificity protein phosphatase 3-like [Homarus americanus]KAG7153895.1 Dual specificity protein phosphatase 3-like [Homarus americanus]